MSKQASLLSTLCAFNCLKMIFNPFELNSCDRISNSYSRSYCMMRKLKKTYRIYNDDHINHLNACFFFFFMVAWLALIDSWSLFTHILKGYLNMLYVKCLPFCSDLNMSKQDPARLLQSPNLVALGMPVGYETWPHPLVIGWSKNRLGLPQSQWIVSSCDRWEFPLVFFCFVFFRGHRQSPCTALTAGKCLPLGLCKETVKQSRIPVHMSLEPPD